MIVYELRHAYETGPHTIYPLHLTQAGAEAALVAGLLANSLREFEPVPPKPDEIARWENKWEHVCIRAVEAVP